MSGKNERKTNENCAVGHLFNFLHDFSILPDGKESRTCRPKDFN